MIAIVCMCLYYMCVVGRAVCLGYIKVNIIIIIIITVVFLRSFYGCHWSVTAVHYCVCHMLLFSEMMHFML